MMHRRHLLAILCGAVTLAAAAPAQAAPLQSIAAATGPETENALLTQVRRGGRGRGGGWGRGRRVGWRRGRGRAWGRRRRFGW
ncbi:MAG: hypothetical protein ACRCTD_07445 [Beijerinckiaceae bacterium]